MENDAAIFLSKDKAYDDLHKALDQVPGFGSDVSFAMAAGKEDRTVNKSANVKQDMDTFERSYKCPITSCGSRFTVIIPLGRGYEFDCPLRHNGTRPIMWWAPS